MTDTEIEAVAKAAYGAYVNGSPATARLGQGAVWDDVAEAARVALDAHRASQAQLQANSKQLKDLEKAHVITTAEELEALPERTVLLDSEGCVLQVVEFDCPNHGEGDYCVWDGCTGRQRWYDGIGSRSGSEVVYLPATVLTPTPEPTVGDQGPLGSRSAWAAEMDQMKPSPTPEPTTNGCKCLCHRWAAHPCLACESDGYDTPVVVDGRDAYATPWPTPEPNVKVCGKFHPQLGTCVRKAGHKKSHRSSYKDGREYFWRDSDEPTVKPDREAVAETVYALIASERVYTIMPTGPNRAQVPGHHRAVVDVWTDAILALLPGKTEREVAEAAWEQGATDYAKYMVAEESYYNGGGVYLSPPDEPVNPHRAKGATND